MLLFSRSMPNTFYFGHHYFIFLCEYSIETDDIQFFRKYSHLQWLYFFHILIFTHLSIYLSIFVVSKCFLKIKCYKNSSIVYRSTLMIDSSYRNCDLFLEESDLLLVYLNLLTCFGLLFPQLLHVSIDFNEVVHYNSYLHRIK